MSGQTDFLLQFLSPVGLGAGDPRAGGGHETQPLWGQGGGPTRQATRGRGTSDPFAVVKHFLFLWAGP